jgi:hypothetical protein
MVDARLLIVSAISLHIVGIDRRVMSPWPVSEEEGDSYVIVESSRAHQPKWENRVLENG